MKLEDLSEDSVATSRVPSGIGSWIPRNRSARWWQAGLAVTLGCLLACGGESEEAAGDEDAASANAGSELALSLLERVDHLEALAREPMVVRHPEGSLFVSGYPSQVTGMDPESPPQLWRSDDGGSSWLSVDAGGPAAGAAGNSDVDLDVSANGVLYFAAMGFDREKRAGTHVAIGRSDDLGESWTWNRVSETPFDDRPWVSALAGDNVHAIWNDGEGVSHAVSVDAGLTWEERPRVHELGGSSHLAAGPSGELAVRISPISASGNRFDEGLELIAVSADGGASWEKHEVPGQRSWDPTFQNPEILSRWVEPLAWTEDGALHHLWSEGSTVWLATSTDQGATWNSRVVAEPEGLAFFPFMVARGGRLAATWFEQSGTDLFLRVTVLDPEGEPWPSERFQADAFNESDDPDVAALRSTAGEYVPVVWLTDKTLGVVTPVQDAANDRWGFTWWRFGLSLGSSG